MTRPRVAVLESLGADPHLRAEQVITAVRRDGEVSSQAVYDVLSTLSAHGLVRRIQPTGSWPATSPRPATTITTSSAAPAAPSPTSNARSARRPASPPRTITASPSTRPRSPTGASARTAHPPATPDTSPLSEDHQAARRRRRRDERARGPVPRRRPGRTTAPPTRPRAAATATWWPNQLNLKVLAKNPAVANPLGADFDYAAAFPALDLDAVKDDIGEVLTTSQDWWPADFGHYGPLIIRMAWHSAGTYRISDGRGGAGAGQQRFAPLNSWPDNANLDKARRLLWPVKKKYGQSLSWADLHGPGRQRRPGVDGLRRRSASPAVARTCGSPTRTSTGARRRTWLGDERYSGDRELENPLAAVQMGLIYVNPEGPNGNPDPLAAARDIRETFAADGDERRGDRGAHRRRPHVRQDPRRGRPAERTSAPSPRALRWRSRAWAGRTAYGTGKGADAITSGLEVTWTVDADAVEQRLLRQPVRLRVGADQEPGRRAPVAGRRTARGAGTVPGRRRRRRAAADDADHRPRAALRPGLRADLPALPTSTPTSSPTRSPGRGSS